MISVAFADANVLQTLVCPLYDLNGNNPVWRSDGHLDFYFIEMDDIDEISKLLEDNTLGFDEKEACLSKIAKHDRAVSIPFLLSTLQNTRIDKGIRGLSAIYLGEMGANESVQPLITLIKEPGNINHRGTYIYALWELDCIEHFLLFIELVCDSNFECRRMADFLVEKYADEISLNTRIEAMNILNTYKTNYEEGRYDKTKYNDKEVADVLEGIEIAIELME